MKLLIQNIGWMVFIVCIALFMDFATYFSRLMLF